jgi:nucleotide-binding universal stress UspA family protein
MTPPILLCADGSDESLDALAAGLGLLGPGDGYVLVTVADAPDPEVLSGTGHAGAEMSAEEFDLAVGHAHESARQVLTEAEARLGLDDVEVRVLAGEPAAAICGLADELGARAIVIGTRGRGGLKRALLGRPPHRHRHPTDAVTTREEPDHACTERLPGVPARPARAHP